MKKIITTLFFVISLIGFTQKSGKIDLSWTIGSKIPFENFEFKTPFFQMENFELKLNEKQILFNLIIQDIGFANEKSLKISNLTYEFINLSQLGDLDVNLISELNNSELINLEGRDNFSSLIKLSPIIKDGASYKIIKSFEYSFDFENPSKISRRPPGIISNSVLAAGSWYRFYIQKSGVYLINKTFLKQLGIPIENVDPRNIRIYGNGGRMLPLKNSTFYPEDLTENAIQVLGETDGVFNDSDAILLYGEGIDNWSEENLTFGNLYEDKSYYYVNFDLGAGKRIPEMMQPTGSPTTIFTTTTASIFI